MMTKKTWSGHGSILLLALAVLAFLGLYPLAEGAGRDSRYLEGEQALQRGTLKVLEIWGSPEAKAEHSKAQALYRNLFAPAIQGEPYLQSRLDGAWKDMEKALAAGDAEAYGVHRELALKGLYGLTLEGLKKALVQQDAAQAGAWFQVREQRQKFSSRPDQALLLMNRLEENPADLAVLGPEILQDLSTTYALKGRDALREGFALLDKGNSRGRAKLAQALAYLWASGENRNKLTGDELAKAEKGLRQGVQGRVPGQEERSRLEELFGKVHAKPLVGGALRALLNQTVRQVDYISRNYSASVKDGKVINPAEYGELRVFSQEARGRFLEMEAALPPGPQRGELLAGLETLEEMLGKKAPLEEVQQTASRITGILKAFGGDGGGNTPAGDPLENSRELLRQAKEAYGLGDMDSAKNLAFEAYFAFEPAEASLGAKDPALLQEMEGLFADFRNLTQGRGQEKELEKAYARLEDGLDRAAGVLGGASGPWAAFVQSLMILLREGLEAILILAALVTYLVRAGEGERNRYIYGGAVMALVASFLTAWLMSQVLHVSGANREALEGVIMLVAVAVLFYVSYWLVSQAQGQRWQQYVKEQVQRSVSSGQNWALGGAAFLAVYREGFETVLFYQALFSGSPGQEMAVMGGMAAAAAALAVISLLFYRFGVKIPLKPFFYFTGAFLYLMAFVFAGKAMAELQEGQWLPSTVLTGWPHVDLLGIFPTAESLAAQSVLLLAALAAGWLAFRPQDSGKTT